MKNSSKLFLNSIYIFIFCLIGMSSLFCLLHRSQELNIAKVFKIISSIGLVSSLIPTIIFIFIYYLLKTLHNKLARIIIIVVLLLILLFSLYNLTLAMVFYHLEDKKSFLESFLEIF